MVSRPIRDGRVMMSELPGRDGRVRVGQRRRFDPGCWAGIILGVLLAWLAAARVVPAVAASDLFPRVAALLEARCVRCHGVDVQEGGFDLTTREGILAGGDGGPALVPGQPDQSPLYHRVVPRDGQRPEMPPRGEPLTREEAELVRAWIAAGAAWPAGRVLSSPAKADKSFWSFRPLARVRVPDARGAPAAWRANPVDCFVWAGLESQGLTPNPPADPRIFIRRATYDLTGLPPTPDETEDFVAAFRDRPDASIHELIDRLLASPRYGERWGRHWLDITRFGESRGYERNQIITNLWPFRDYVIASFQEDKPIDRMIQEHIAGDVMAPGDFAVEVGSAFLVAGPYDDVGNQDAVAAAQIRADQLDEMIRATCEAFLGLTVGCARCHDHKFDPITQRDYYSLYATFAGTTHGEREVAGEEVRKSRAARREPLAERHRQLTAERDAIREELTARARAVEPVAEKQWLRPPASRYGTEETFPPREARFVRLVVDGTDSNDPGQTQFRLDEFEVWTDEPNPRNVALADHGAVATGETAREARDFAGAYGVALVNDGRFGERWHAAGNQLQLALARTERVGRVVFSSDRTQALGEDNPLTTFVGDYSLEVSEDGKTWQQVASSADRRPPCEARRRARLLRQITTRDDMARLDWVQASLREASAALDAAAAGPLWWVGLHQPAPGPFHVLTGGSVQRPGERVAPASPQWFDHASMNYQLTADSPEGERRLALARWLTAPENPLVPRVLVNRVWHYHFGRGIVDTPSDFGFMGGRPTHPELLDWLARELQRQAWRIKPLHRIIMTSQAYRQSSLWRPTAAGIDGDARYLWRFPPRRLDAEQARDTLLAVAGRLDLRMGGPGFRLYDYQQDNVATYVPLDVHGPETYRRAVYHHNARAARVDVLTDFDCPDPAFAEPRRAATTTPLQALTLLNHRFAWDMAEAFADRLQREGGAEGLARVERGFALAFGRRPTSDEADAGVQLARDHGLVAFCRALLNANELLYLD